MKVNRLKKIITATICSFVLVFGNITAVFSQANLEIDENSCQT